MLQCTSVILYKKSFIYNRPLKRTKKYFYNEKDSSSFLSVWHSLWILPLALFFIVCVLIPLFVSNNKKIEHLYFLALFSLTFSQYFLNQMLVFFLTTTLRKHLFCSHNFRFHCNKYFFIYCIRTSFVLSRIIRILIITKYVSWPCINQ